ncbi:MAG: amidohydrolase family protein [Desulfobacterales bacterium]|jgi:imidazolonepropionase-like amidohydrolase
MRDRKIDSVDLKDCTLLGGWLVDGTGDPARQNQALKIANGQIQGICSSEEVSPEEDLLDFSGDTVLPCLVDSHVHLFMSGTTDARVRQEQLEARFEEILPRIDARIGRYAACGIAAVRDGGDARGHALRYRSEILPKRFAWFTVRSPGRAFRSAGRYGKLIGRPPEAGRTLADSIAAEADGADHVKIVNSGLNSLLSFGKTTAPQFSLDVLSAAVRAARRRGWKVMVHANGPEPVRMAVAAGCHSIEHGFFMGIENLQRMAERGTVWVPTAVTMKAYAESLPAGSREAAGAARNLEHQLGQIEAARRLGVTVAAGSDAGSLNVHHGSGCIEEIRLLASAGFSIEEAVCCASVKGARLLGLERAGRRVAAGRPASFVVCTGGPERLPDSLRRVKALYVEGNRVLPP